MVESPVFQIGHFAGSNPVQGAYEKESPTMVTQTKSGRTVYWTMCRCYVWPVYAEYWSPDYIGRCGRCGEGARGIPAGDKKEAVAYFEAEYGRRIAPIKS